MIIKYRQFIAGAAVAAMALSACGTIASDTAMTVGDRTVSMDLLEELSDVDVIKERAADNVGLVSTADGRAGGPTYRAAASSLVTFELYGLLLERFDAEVTDADEVPIDPEAELSDEINDFVTEFNARASVFARVVAEQQPTEQDLRSIYALSADGFTDTICVDGVQAPSGLADEIRASLADGTDYSAIAESNPNEALLIAPPGDLNCFTDEQLGDPELVADLAEAEIGEVVELVEVDQTGEEFYVFLTVRSRGDLAFEDTFVQNQLTAIFADPERSVDAWLAVEADQSGVEIDPRVGTFNSLTVQVDPPPVPGQPAPAVAPLG